MSPRPTRRHLILTALGPHDLLVSTQEPARCRTIVLHLALHVPTKHCTRKSPRPCVWDRISLPRGWGQGLALGLDKTHPGLLSIGATFALPLPTCHHCLPFSALTSPQRCFVSNVPQWDPLMLQETLELASDFDSLRGFINFLSGSEVHGLGTKPKRGDIKMPWAGPLLLSWSRLLGWKELMATGLHCRETALPRSSSSAKRSRAKGTPRVSQGGEQGRLRA